MSLYTKIKDYIENCEYADKIEGSYIFGSRVEGNYRDDSDLDIGILHTSAGICFEDMEEALSQITGYDVEITTINLDYVDDFDLLYNILTGINIYVKEKVIQLIQQINDEFEEDDTWLLIKEFEDYGF